MITTTTANRAKITDPMPEATNCRAVATNVRSGRTYALDSSTAPISFHAELLAQATLVPQVGNWVFGVLSGGPEAMRGLAWSRDAHQVWMQAHAELAAADPQPNMAAFRPRTTAAAQQ